MNTLYAVAVTAMLVASAASAKDMTAEVGELQTANGHKVALGVAEQGPYRTATLWVADKHLIKTNLVWLNRSQLLKLRDMVDATVAELDKLEAQAGSSAAK